MNFKKLALLRKYLSIKNSSPGSIRVKFSPAILTDPELLKVIKSPPDKPEAITHTKLKLLSRILLIEYDATRVDSTLLEKLITSPDDQQAANIVEQLHATLYS